MSPDWFDQSGHRLRFDWGADGLGRLAPACDVVVVVDVLRFTTCVDVALARGAEVLPYPWRDESGAAAHAAAHGAELAGSREDPATPWSLSPTDLQAIPAGTRLVLPSPNGSSLALGARDLGAGTVVAGCLRNAGAVGRWAADRGAIGVIAAGEQHEGRLRPSLEDLLGAGAILAACGDGRSPEAESAVAAFEAVRGDVEATLLRCASGRELVARGWSDDVGLAAQHDVSETVPVLRDEALVDAGQ